MDLLRIDNGKIIQQNGEPLQLRGVCIGGWMNMESFINGFPGTETSQREVMKEVLGEEKASFFFDRWMDIFFAEEDAEYIRSLGATVVRLPLNYRHFESDDQPFEYLEAGFTRLDQALSWCEKYGLYVILDMHAAPGWQNPDWHSDNPTGVALLWKQRFYQERLVALWREVARRYAGRGVIAGYDLLNEPLTNDLSHLVHTSYQGTWAVMNSLYRKLVQAIREVDTDHIIFLEGDGFASKFSGLELPFARNLAYSSHNYNRACWGPGEYPGTHREGFWDRKMVEKVFLEGEGTQFTSRNNVPLWVGEFGPVFNGVPADRPSRLRGFRDTLSVFNQYGVHWTAWTYKDIGVMGWVLARPDCEFLERLASLQSARRTLHIDSWMYWMPQTKADSLLADLAGIIHETGSEHCLDRPAIQGRLARASLAGTAGHLLQVAFARAFEGCSVDELDSILQSFALRNCQINAELIDLARSAMQPEAEMIGKYGTQSL